MAGIKNNVLVAKNADFTQVNAPNPTSSESNGLILDGQLWIGRSSVNAGGTHIDVNTLTAGTGITINNGPGNIQISSTAATTDLHVAKWIVNSTPNAGGNQTTITSALAVASAGDTIFVMPGATGIYTENLTLKAGVNIVAFDGDGDTPNVTIIGKMTMTVAGTVSISGIRLQTNSDFLLAVTGSAASIVNLNECYLNMTNNTGISFSSSNAAAGINIFRCKGDLGTTGITLFTSSSTGTLRIFASRFTNSGSSTTSTTFSAGALNMNYSYFENVFTTSGTSTLTTFSNQYNSVTSTTALTIGGSGTNFSYLDGYSTAVASSISIGSNLNISGAVVGSTNTNAITGLGTITYSGITFNSTSNVINTSTQVGKFIDSGGISFDGGTNNLQNYAVGTFIPTLTGNSTAGVTTYTSQNGYYTRVGNLVTCIGSIVLTAATGTGNALIGALPFTIKNQTNGVPIGHVSVIAAGWAWPAGATSLSLYGTINSISAQILVSGTSTGGNFLQMANAANTVNFTITYQI